MAGAEMGRRVFRSGRPVRRGCDAICAVAAPDDVGAGTDTKGQRMSDNSRTARRNKEKRAARYILGK